jgi:hypothetical protein
MLWEYYFKFYKSYLNSNSNRITYDKFCWCLGTSLCSIWWFIFWVLDPPTLRGHNFFNFISFLIIFNALDAPIGRIQVLFGNRYFDKKLCQFFFIMPCVRF